MANHVAVDAVVWLILLFEMGIDQLFLCGGKSCCALSTILNVSAETKRLAQKIATTKYVIITRRTVFLHQQNGPLS